MAITLLIVFVVLLVMLAVMTHRIYHLLREYTPDASSRLDLPVIQALLYGALVLCVVAIVVATYYLVAGSPWQGHLMEWLNIAVRVMHVTFGIAWIGASFYFVFLENALNRTEDVRDELAGNLWAVHGGGFYYLEKYKVAPKTMPKHLHWFKYEAYFTWISGFCLLFIIYYLNASALLIDPQVMRLSTPVAILIGVGSFVLAWVLYDQLCKSPLIRIPWLFNLLLVVMLALFAWGYAHIFSGRGAYIHFGAMIGSLMVGNVFFVIIPAQKAMVAAAKRGELPDGRKGKKALQRSLHNNYFTLPVLFVMVSNHFPSTFGNRQQWLVLLLISAGAAGIKHWLNLRERGRSSIWVLPVSVLVLLATAYVTGPRPVSRECKPVSFAQVNGVVQQRCVQCHSARPTDDVYTAAPNGVMYDVPADIVRKKDLILQRVVLTKTMPQNNKTNMTEEERELIRCWIEQGAKLQ